MKKTLTIAMVAGESSGDILGADLIQALRQYQDIEWHFEGVGGPLMQQQGFHSLYPMDRLSVMGLVEPLKRLPELLAMRRSLRQRWLQNPPDIMLGIDSPDFNLDLELALRGSGIKTAHYVSPSVWAWRQGRIKKIARAVDLMLTLLPFEAAFYRQHQVPVSFVGHPLADQIPMQPDQGAARAALDIEPTQAVVALLPGSRGGEVSLLAPLFLQTARLCLQQQPGLQFIIPAASDERYQQLLKILADWPDTLPVRLIKGESKTVMTAADVVLMASGTTTLEAMLLKKPMVVAYKLSALTYSVVSRLVKAPYISLPNLLAQQELVPERVQQQATAENLAPLLLQRLQGDNSSLLEAFSDIHRQLQQGAGQKAAAALLQLLDSDADGDD